MLNRDIKKNQYINKSKIHTEETIKITANVSHCVQGLDVLAEFKECVKPASFFILYSSDHIGEIYFTKYLG